MSDINVNNDYTKMNNLSPFKLCVLQNFPFIEADFDVVTNYQLLCKVVEYLNNVIDNNNKQNTNITQLEQNFITLYNYVKDYFDNLDVQEEINNKLDEMVSDGTFITLLKELFPIVTPEMYGAKGDGVTDDTTAIQNVINNTFSSFILFSGNYLINDTILISKSNIYLKGVNNAKIIAGTMSATKKMFYIYSVNELKNITFETLEINGNAENRIGDITWKNNGGAIFGKASDRAYLHDISIINCYIHNNKGYGVTFDGFETDVSRQRIVYNLLIKDCVITNTYCNICQSQVSSLITGCFLSNSTLENMTIDNNCNEVKVIGNTLKKHNAGAGNIGTDGSTNVIITNNIIDNGNDTTAQYNCGITFNCNTGTCENYIISNNRIVGNAQYGIWFRDKISSRGYYGAKNCTITGNIFESNAQGDISIEAITDGKLIFTGNYYGDNSFIIPDSKKANILRHVMLDIEKYVTLNIKYPTNVSELVKIADYPGGFTSTNTAVISFNVEGRTGIGCFGSNTNRVFIVTATNEIQFFCDSDEYANKNGYITLMRTDLDDNIRLIE